MASKDSFDPDDGRESGADETEQALPQTNGEGRHSKPVWTIAVIGFAVVALIAAGFAAYQVAAPDIRPIRQSNEEVASKGTSNRVEQATPPTAGRPETLVAIVGTGKNDLALQVLDPQSGSVVRTLETFAASEEPGAVSLSTDGKTVYYSTRSSAAGNGATLWRQPVDGSGKRVSLLAGPSDFEVSPQGDKVAYRTIVDFWDTIKVSALDSLTSEQDERDVFRSRSGSNTLLTGFNWHADNEHLLVSTDSTNGDIAATRTFGFGVFPTTTPIKNGESFETARFIHLPDTAEPGTHWSNARALANGNLVVAENCCGGGIVGEGIGGSTNAYNAVILVGEDGNLVRRIAATGEDVVYNVEPDRDGDHILFIQADGNRDGRGDLRVVDGQDQPVTLHSEVVSADWR